MTHVPHTTAGHSPAPSLAVLLNVFATDMGVTTRNLAIGFVGGVMERWCGGKMTPAVLRDRNGARKNQSTTGQQKPRGAIL